MKARFDRYLKPVTMAAAVLLLLALAAGCNTKAPAENEQGAKKKPAAAEGVTQDSQDPNKGAHAKLSPQKIKEIEGDGLAALKVLEGSKGDAARLKSAFMDEALKTTEKAYADDLAAGKIKIRRYGKPRMTVVNYINGLAGVAAQFVDQGYYIDVVTKKIIAPPSNKTYRFIFAMKQQGGTWKVSQIFESDVARSDPKAKQDGTINAGTQNH